MNEWISDKAVYRIAPATPGLLKIVVFGKGEAAKVEATKDSKTDTKFWKFKPV